MGYRRLIGRSFAVLGLLASSTIAVGVITASPAGACAGTGLMQPLPTVYTQVTVCLPGEGGDPGTYPVITPFFPPGLFGIANCYTINNGANLGYEQVCLRV
jgi:hypothetical protein